MTPQDFKRELKKYGINSNQALEGHVFLLSLGTNKKHERTSLEFGFGSNKDIDIKIAGSKKLRQAVITVVEKERVLSSLVDSFLNEEEKEHLIEEFNITNEKRVFSLGEDFDMGSLVADFPTVGAVLSSQNANLEEIKASYSISYVDQKVDKNMGDIMLNIKVPKTTMCFLVGYDEKEMFVSLLPKTVKTVENAHKALKPKGLRPGWKRQGEWFFNPCTKKEKEALIKEIEKKGMYSIDHERPLESGSEDHYSLNSFDFRYSHQIKTKEGEILKGKKYVSGFIENERHDLLVLDGWYEPVLNNEIEGGEDELWD